MDRLDERQLLDLFESPDLIALGRAADLARQELHPGSIVSYVVDRNINYTNACVSGCKFCAYFRAPGREDAFVMSMAELRGKLAEAKDLGATQVLLQGGLHPELRLDYYRQVLSIIKQEFGLHAHCFSPPEIAHIARVEGLGVAECLRQLQEAGLDTVPGGGAEVLSDEIRARVSPQKCSKIGRASCRERV